jgi:hypothetical protein
VCEQSNITLGTGRHWVGTNTGQIDVYTLAMRGLAGFEAILTREFHRIPHMGTPQDNHPRGDISEWRERKSVL